MPNEEEIAHKFLRALNSHGHAFQQTVIRACHDLAIEYTNWQFEVGEFPVQLREADTSLDVVLSLRSQNLYLVVECKRADPNLAHWCFARTPYVLRGARRTDPMLTAVFHEPGRVVERPHRLSTGDEVYHVAHELKTGKTGSGVPGGRGAVSDAVNQVLRGAGGLIETLVRHRAQALPVGTPVLVVPAVFTTAQLFVTDADLSNADLQTGDLATAPLRPCPWLWYMAHQSASQRADLPIVTRGTPVNWNLSRLLTERLARAVAIVNVPDGIAGFLARMPDDIEDMQPL
jgi:hypothetical protein